MDDIATPDALADWLRSRDLLLDGALVDAGSFVRARALRRVLRALASRNAHGSSSDDDLRVEFATLASELPLRFALGERGGLRLAPADRGVNGALAEILSRVFEAQTSGEWRRLKSCPGPHCGWLFYDASRNASSTVVLDVDLREPDEDRGVPAAPEDGDVRSAWFVTTLAWKRLRRRDSGALVTVLGLAVATAVLAGVFAGVTIASDRCDGAGDRAHPGLGAFGAGGVVRHPGRCERTTRRARWCRRRGVRRLRARRPDAPDPVPREHRGGTVRRHHGDRRRGRARDPAIGSSAAHVHARPMRGAPLARPRSVAELPGPPDRRGRHGNAALAPALRRLPPLERCRHR